MRLKKRIAEIEEKVKELEKSKSFAKIQELELEIEKFRTQLLSLRGLFNRTRAKSESFDETGDDSEQGKSNKVLLPEK